MGDLLQLPERCACGGIIGYLLAGVALGPHGLEFVTDATTINHMGSLGVMLLLFFIGMEVSPYKLVQGWRVAVIGMLAQILVGIALVWGIGTLFVAWFFVSVGLLVDLYFIAGYWLQVSLLVFAVLVTNTFVNAGALRGLGISISVRSK